jgi:hypothetical protein
MIYKLTTQDNRTRPGYPNETHWGENVTNRAVGDVEDGLCSAGYIHAYEHPLLAALMNDVHVNYENPKLWEAEGEIILRDGQLKCGCRQLTTIREIPLPEISRHDRMVIGIRCVLAVYDGAEFVSWANKWLSGEDRSTDAAEDMYKLLYRKRSGSPDDLSILGAIDITYAAICHSDSCNHYIALSIERSIEVAPTIDLLTIIKG